MYSSRPPVGGEKWREERELCGGGHKGDMTDRVGGRVGPGVDRFDVSCWVTLGQKEEKEVTFDRLLRLEQRKWPSDQSHELLVKDAWPALVQTSEELQQLHVQTCSAAGCQSNSNQRCVCVFGRGLVCSCWWSLTWMLHLSSSTADGSENAFLSVADQRGRPLPHLLRPLHLCHLQAVLAQVLQVSPFIPVLFWSNNSKTVVSKNVRKRCKTGRKKKHFCCG